MDDDMVLLVVYIYHIYIFITRHVFHISNHARSGCTLMIFCGWGGSFGYSSSPITIMGMIRYFWI